MCTNRRHRKYKFDSCVISESNMCRRAHTLFPQAADNVCTSHFCMSFLWHWWHALFPFLSSFVPLNLTASTNKTMYSFADYKQLRICCNANKIFIEILRLEWCGDTKRILSSNVTSTGCIYACQHGFYHRCLCDHHVLLVQNSKNKWASCTHVHHVRWRRDRQEEMGGEIM